MTPLLEEYVRIQCEAMKQWGDKTVVFMMVGSFYEVYEILDGHGGVHGKAKDVSEMCHIILTRKNKNLPFAVNNPYMCGFPLYCRDRYIDRLASAGYTIVVYDQTNGNPTIRERRMVCGPLVGSAMTMTPDDEDMPENPMDTVDTSDRVGISIIIGRCDQRDDPGNDPQPHRDDRILSAIIMNLTTGVISMYEKYASGMRDVRIFLDRLFLRYAPIEICWWKEGRGGAAAVHSADDELLNLLKKDYPHVMKWHEHVISETMYYKISYQAEMLRKAFKCDHTDLDLERFAITSINLVAMLDFLYQHHPLLLQRLCRPVWGEPAGVVDYLPHTLKEMHLLVGAPSLFSLMDKTCTRMGHRRYRSMWFQPKTDITGLDAMYDRIDNALRTHEIAQRGRATLSRFHDWESTIRRMKSGCFSCRRLSCLWRDIENWSTEMGDSLASRLLESLEERFYKDRVDSSDWNKPMTRKHHDQAKDPVVLIPLGDPLVLSIMEQVGVSSDRIIVQEGKDDIYVTVKRMPKSVTSLHGGFVLRSMAGGLRIYHAEWSRRASDHRHLLCEREKSYREWFRNEAQDWFLLAYPLIASVLDKIIETDILWSHVTSVRSYGLTRPVWDTEQTTLYCHNLRNPIVEHTHPLQKFVTNDLDLAEDQQGMLLYGQNSAGKSTFLKSVGMNVWLAQTGHFVFADKFRGRPFHRILTKLTIHDNLFRGVSTFQNEMMDLRYILNRIAMTDNPCLILCDELTAGTETWSATAIMATTLLEFMKHKNTMFLCTTHLHTLQLYNDIYTDGRLCVCHAVLTKQGSQDPMFRKIMPGEGPVMYGIEIAEQLGFPSDFIAKCFHYRRLMNDRVSMAVMCHTKPDRGEHLVATAPTRYNKNVTMDHCHRCSTKVSLQAHHKIHQEHASERHGKKIIPGTGGQSIHSAWNLQILCEQCHHREHATAPAGTG